MTRAEGCSGRCAPRTVSPKWRMPLIMPCSSALPCGGSRGVGGEHGGLGGCMTGADAELGQDGGDVVVDGLGGDDQLGGDLRIGAPGADKVEDLPFAGGQAAGMLAGGGVL